MHHKRALAPLVAATISRDRLKTFRRLFLGLAAFTVLGLFLTLIIQDLPGLHDRVLNSAAMALLLGCWALGYRLGRFPLAVLAAELLLLSVIMIGLPDELAVLGCTYVAVQFRALYGSRRDALVMTAGYAGVFLVSLDRLYVVHGIMRPVVAIEVVVLAICAYVMHALAEVLARDLDRTNALRRSEDRYRAMFNHNPFPMWVVDLDSLMLRDANAAAVLQYGYTRDEFIGMSIGAIRAPGALADLEQMNPEFRSERRLHFRARHRRRDGSEFEVEITSQVMDFGGARVRVAVAVDVSQRERALLALRESEQRFRSVAENLREALMITDLEDRITFANQRVREVLGYEPAELIGRRASEVLLTSDKRDAFVGRLFRRLEGEGELYELELLRKDGSRIAAEISASPYRDGFGTVIGTLGVMSDVTDQRRMEARLQHAMRMEAIGQLAGGVAHDFNNLLTVIKLNTELLLDDLGPGSSMRDSIEDIERSASRGAELTRQLLAFGGRQVLQPRRIVLADVVSDAMPVLRRVVDRRTELAMTSDNARGHVFADPMQIEQVLAGLVRNAEDAMPEGGLLTIDTRVAVLTEKTDPERPAGAYAVLSVSDTGTGMTDEVKRHLFEPFFTTKGLGKGTGLGLASIYGIVRQSGGFLDVQSEIGIGTVVRIYLPYARAAGTDVIVPAGAMAGAR